VLLRAATSEAGIALDCGRSLTSACSVRENCDVGEKRRA
jgi:hypothetical protein